MRKGEIEGRLDPNYIYLSQVLKEKFKRSNYEFTNFGKCIDYIQYGISSLANTEQKGVPIIRMGNLRGDEWEFSNLKHIELSDKDLGNYKLLNGDLLFNRTNSKELVGKCAVFREKGDWVFASYLIRVRVDEDLLLPDFASFFLGSTVGRMQIDCLSRQIIGMTNINAEEIKLIKIPIPPLEVQAQIIEKFEAAYNAKRAKEAEAKSLLDGIDAYLLERLGIETPAAIETKKTFFTRASKLSGGRFDPSFYKPNFQKLVSALENQPYKRLHEIVKFSSETWNQKDLFENTFPYIEISEIDLSKGEINNIYQIPIAEAPSRAKMIVRNGDIIVSTTRPSRGAIARITERENFSIASTGFAVIRNVNTEFTRKQYLFSVLRHRICLLQMEQRSSGGNYPAITIEELGNVLIPLPPLDIQEEIAAHIQSIRTRAGELERDAHREVERARQEVERMILGEVRADA